MSHHITFQQLVLDFRLGGLAAGEHKTVRGKMFIVSNDLPALLNRYQRAFPSVTTAR